MTYDSSDPSLQGQINALDKLAHTAAPDLAEQFFTYIRLNPETVKITPLSSNEAGHFLTLSAAPDLAELFFKNVTTDDNTNLAGEG
jgi:hypothetical protein